MRLYDYYYIYINEWSFFLTYTLYYYYKKTNFGSVLKKKCAFIFIYFNLEEEKKIFYKFFLVI